MTVSKFTNGLVRASALSLIAMPAAYAVDHSGEHQFQLKTRAMYFDRDFKDGSSDREQSALGFQLNYASPQYNDLVGFGFSGYLVTELGHSGAEREDILTKDGDGLDGFALLGQTYINITPTENSGIKLGRQLHKSMLLSSSGSRAAPSTFQGISGFYSPTKGLTLYGAVYDEWSRRSRDNFEDFKTDQSGSGDIDYVGIVGVKYKTDQYSLEAEHLVSDDYLAKTGVRGSYTFPLEASKLKVSGGVFVSDDDGALFVIGSESGELDDEDAPGGTVGVTRSDNDGLGAFIDLAWSKENAEYSIAYTQIDGAWLEDNFAGDHGTNPFPTSSTLGADLTNEDQRVVRLKLKYNWKDYVPGLVSTVSVAHGWDAENSENSALGDADEDWQEVRLDYSPAAAKGLKLTGLWHNYEPEETGSIDGVKGDEDDIRLYADYTINF